MSEMVERVSAIITAELMELTAEQRAKFIFPDDANGDTCDRARSCARAAIEAMREPTDAMKTAGQALAYEGWGDGSEIAKLSWQTMIDAALGKKP